MNTDADRDQLLRGYGERWRQAQPAPPRYDVEQLVSDEHPSRRRGWLAPTAAVAIAVAIVATIVVYRLDAPRTAVPVSPAVPVPTSTAVAPAQVVGTWFASVGLTKARAPHRSLVGNWTLALDPGGQARLVQQGESAAASGEWSLSDGTLTLRLPFAGCLSTTSSYLVDRSALHTQLMELVPRQESCLERSLVVGGHWSSTTGAG